MAKFLVALIGEGIVLDGMGDMPASGFVVMKVLKADSSELAEQQAKIMVLHEWRQLFNRSNKKGTPQLCVHKTERIRNPFRSFKNKTDFMFFSDNTEKERFLTECS